MEKYSKSIDMIIRFKFNEIKAFSYRIKKIRKFINMSKL